MSRSVSKIGSAREWYVVNIDDNRKDPDPFRVLISPMTGAEMRAYDDAALNFGGSVMQRVNYVMDQIVERHVHEVYGYAVIDAKTEVMQRPTDGATLVACIKASYESEMRVLEDIILAIKNRSHLSDGLLKKLQPLSDSGQTANHPLGNGDAASVDAPSEQTQTLTSVQGESPGIAMLAQTPRYTSSSIQT